MPEHASEALKAKARRELWFNAFFRFESALLIASTLILSSLAGQGVPWLPGTWQLWLGLGGLAETGLVFSTVTDRKLFRKLVEKNFEANFELQKIHSQALQKKVHQALGYRKQIANAIASDESKLNRELFAITQSLEDWVSQIYQLAISLDGFQRDEVIAKNRSQVPKEIKRLLKKLEHEDNQKLIKQIRVSLATKNEQLTALNTLGDTMESAQLQLDNTLASMSTIYTQTLALGIQDLDVAKTKSLEKEMQEQIRSLRDIGSAMDEVYHLD